MRNKRFTIIFSMILALMFAVMPVFAGGASASSHGDQGATIQARTGITGFTARYMVNNKVHLSWDPVSGALRYDILRTSNPNGVYMICGQSTTPNYYDWIRTEGNYYYQVRAVFAGSARFVLSDRIPAVYDPATTSITLYSSSQSHVAMTWTYNYGAVGYEVYRKVGSGSYQYAARLGATTWYMESGLSAGTTYSYKVRPIFTADYLGSFSQPLVVTTGSVFTPTPTPAPTPILVPTPTPTAVPTASPVPETTPMWQSWAQSTTIEQNDLPCGPWGSIVLGTSANGTVNTLGNYGCAIMSWGKACIQAGLIEAADFMPPEMVDRLRSVNALDTAGSLSFRKAANVFPGITYRDRPDFKDHNGFNLTRPVSLNIITDAVFDRLEQGESVLLHVRRDNYQTPGDSADQNRTHHWVVVDRERTLSASNTSRHIYIFDSLYGTRGGQRVESQYNVGHPVTDRYVRCDEMVCYSHTP